MDYSATQDGRGEPVNVNHVRAAVKGAATAVLTALCLALLASAGMAQELTIAAASDLQAVLPQIAARYEARTGRKVHLTFGSSGNFFAQIQNGAPFDLFFSADIDYPSRLNVAGLADPGSIDEYAIGRIVLWAPKSGRVNVAEGLPVLAQPSVRWIAIANPEHAPYGRAAVAALQSAGLFDRVQSKFVLGENISQAAQFVQSGNAEAGILALSLARAPALMAAGTFYEIPASMYPPIRQAAVVIKVSSHKDAARAFLQFMREPDNQQLLASFGFERPK
jgi:molybdate transport system substrate-binding protein